MGLLDRFESSVDTQFGQELLTSEKRFQIERVWHMRKKYPTSQFQFVNPPDKLNSIRTSNVQPLDDHI